MNSIRWSQKTILAITTEQQQLQQNSPTVTLSISGNFSLVYGFRLSFWPFCFCTLTQIPTTNKMIKNENNVLGLRVLVSLFRKSEGRNEFGMGMPTVCQFTIFIIYYRDFGEECCFTDFQI